MMNAKQMAKENRVSYQTVLHWIKKGYFGPVQKDQRGNYLLAEDLPLPYRADGKIERDTTLMKCFLDASDLGRSVHKNMFPRIKGDRYDRLLSYMREAHLLETQEPCPGVVRFSTTPEGLALLNAEPKAQSKVFERVLECARLALTAAEFGLTFGPQIAELLKSVA